jgi:hypothetical protein
MEECMDVRTDEIGDRIYRISTYLPQAAGGAGFTFNQFLIDDDEPLLFHCGHRKMFPVVSEACKQDHSDQSVALAGVRSFRGRRMWLDE